MFLSIKAKGSKANNKCALSQHKVIISKKTSKRIAKMQKSWICDNI